MKTSDTLSMFPDDLKSRLIEELLALPDHDIKDLVAVFQKEQQDIKKIGDDAVASADNLKKLTTDVVMAGQGLKKALIRSHEDDDKKQEQNVEQDLLNDLDEA